MKTWLATLVRMLIMTMSYIMTCLFKVFVCKNIIRTSLALLVSFISLARHNEIIHFLISMQRQLFLTFSDSIIENFDTEGLIRTSSASLTHNHLCHYLVMTYFLMLNRLSWKYSGIFPNFIWPFENVFNN